MHEILEYKFVVNDLTVRKTRPPLVTVAMPDIQCRSHTTHVLTQWKYIAEQRGNWQHTDREDRAGYFWYETRSQDPQLLNCVIFKEIKTINTVLWLFNVSWQITVLPQFKHVNRSSFHIYLKHEMNMNKHQKVFYFNRGTQHFSRLNPQKLMCSSVWFVVKARRDTAAATGLYAYLHIFQADNITWNLWKWF